MGSTSDYFGISYFNQHLRVEGATDEQTIQTVVYEGTSRLFLRFNRSVSVPFLKIGQIKDGTSNTISFIEKAGLPDVHTNLLGAVGGNQSLQAAWAGNGGLILQGVDPSAGPHTVGLLDNQKGPSVININNVHTPFSFHENGVNASMVDGSVRTLSNDLFDATFGALVGYKDQQLIDLE